MNVTGLPARLLRNSGDRNWIAAGTLVDISPTGVRLIIDQAAPVGELILLEVQLPSDAKLNLSARVAWSKPLGDKFSVGCQLSAPPAGEKLAELRRLAAAGA